MVELNEEGEGRRIIGGKRGHKGMEGQHDMPSELKGSGQNRVDPFTMEFQCHTKPHKMDCSQSSLWI